MENWKNRVMKEKAALDEKIEKLDAFIAADLFWTLSITQQLLLYNQLDHMVQYSALLGQRIEYFDD